MNKNQIDFSDINNRMENIRFKLIFLEAAFRGMSESGIIGEPDISEGISCIFNSVILEYETVIKQFQNITGNRNMTIEN